MQRFDRYMLSQLMVVFSFFALVLVMVYWVNASVSLFDDLITDGHSARIFLEFTLLSLPAVIAMVMPMAAFGAAVYVTNRMSNESEMTVLKAAGLSPWRLARPVLVFGVIVALMASVLAHVLVPSASGTLRLRESEISASVSARLLHEGTFLHPTRGVTFYIRQITPEGELRDVYLSDRRSKGRVMTYTAERAYVLRDDDGTRLTMRTGLAQEFREADATLSMTNFSDLTYDISDLVSIGSTPRRRARQIPTWELLTRTDAIATEVDDSPGEVLQEAHGRFEQPAALHRRRADRLCVADVGQFLALRGHTADRRCDLPSGAGQAGGIGGQHAGAKQCRAVAAGLSAQRDRHRHRRGAAGAGLAQLPPRLRRREATT